jgi:hypothetical protein
MYGVTDEFILSLEIRLKKILGEETRSEKQRHFEGDSTRHRTPIQVGSSII